MPAPGTHLEHKVDRSLLRVVGKVPVPHSSSARPRLQMSAGKDVVWLAILSGDMYVTVPTKVAHCNSGKQRIHRHFYCSSLAAPHHHTMPFLHNMRALWHVLLQSTCAWCNTHGDMCCFHGGH